MRDRYFKREGTLAVLALIFGLVACGPTVLIPGGELRGTLATGTVQDWRFTDTVSTIQLETRPERPYSVNLWGVGSGAAFYVASGSGADARWVAHIGADPRVRLRVGETLYERKAVRVEARDELADVMELYQKKYDVEPEDWRDAWVYRLDAR